MERSHSSSVDQWFSDHPETTTMAKLEIPSIVVQSGSHTPPVMDRAAARSQWSMSTQTTYEDDADPLIQSTNGEIDHSPAVSGDKENEAKNDSKNTNNNNLPRTRSKSSLKLLKRSHAIKESTSPPPDVPLSPVTTTPPNELPQPPSSNNNNNPSTMNNNGLNLRPTMKREGSNQSSDSNWSSSLSRGNSMEQQGSDQAPLNLEQFLADTVNGHAKDRTLMLRVENDLVNLIKDTRKTSHRFGVMSSYQRMLVHRMAHYYGMDHNVDSTGQSVVVSKGKSTKMPVNKLNYFIRDDLLLSEEPRKSILKRDSASFEDTVSFKSPDRHSADGPRRSKSFEEREEEYEKVRARIFHQEHGDHTSEGYPHECQDDLRWTQIHGSWEHSESSDSTKLHPNSHRQSRLTKVESYESRDTLRANSLRSSVSKSYSFGGYDQTSNNRVLTKQDSGSSVSSRVSPSSSGYKSQSQRSDATMSATPSPSATPHLTTQLSSHSGAFSPDIEPEQTVLWAVTNMASVPAGSVLINPQTGQPVKNEDGSLYHYDPDNPPKLTCGADSAPSLRQTAENGRKSDSGNSGVGRSHSESNAASEPAVNTSTAAPAPPVTTFHHIEGPTQTEPESGVSSMPPANTHNYHHIPPPAPTAPMLQPLSYSSSGPTYTAAMMYNTPGPYVMQPPVAEGYAAPPTNTQPILYSLPPAPAAQQYPQAPVTGATAPYDRTMEGQDICGYLMGLSLGDINRSDTQHRQAVYYCHQPSHFPQQATGPGAAHPTVPLYYTPTNTGPPAQPATHQPRYPQCAYQYPQPPERPAPECSFPQPPVHAYFSRCPSTPQVGGASASYCAPSGGSAGSTVTMGTLVLPPTHTQTARPYHRMPTPPNTPQNGCTQYPIYNSGYTAMAGCYQHYQAAANPPSQIPMPGLAMIRPALQLNVGNSPPLRGMRGPTYTAAAATRSPAPPEPQHSSSPMRYAASVPPGTPAPHYLYRFSLPANELIMMNNNRAPFTSPPATNRLPPSVSVNFSSFRRHRLVRGDLGAMMRPYEPHSGCNMCRPRTVGPAATNGRPVFTASQQQAALATAIESAGNHDPNGGFRDWTLCLRNATRQ